MKQLYLISLFCLSIIVIPFGTKGQNTAGCEVKIDVVEKTSQEFQYMFLAYPDADSRIVDWTWKFGDGQMSKGENPSHVFSQSGEYNVCLEAVMSNGCVASTCQTFKLDGDPKYEGQLRPYFDYKIDDSGSGVTFVDKSTGNIGSWTWSLNDSTFSGHQNGFLKIGVPGTYDICLTITSSDAKCKCAESICQQITVGTGANTNQGDCNLDFSSSPCDCIPVHYAFNISENAEDLSNDETYKWTFGDGGYAAVANPVHEFARAGEYKVCVYKISANGEKCVKCKTEFYEGSDTLQMSPIYGTVVDASNLDGCGLVIKTDNGKVLEPVTIIPKIKLSDGMRIKFTYTPSHSMSICMMGETVQINTLELLSLPGEQCRAMFTYNIMSTDDVPPSVIEHIFTDISKGDVAKREWYINNAYISNDKSVNYSFKEIGEHQVTLKIATKDGCTSEYSQKIEVNYVPNPDCQSYFYANMNNDAIVIPEYKAVDFINESRGENLSYYWEFADGKVSTEKNPSHNFYFLDSPVHKVCLTVKNDAGCKNTSCNNVYTGKDTLIEPLCKPMFEYKILNEKYPVEVAFLDQSTGKVKSWLWDFGDGEQNKEQNPVHKYTIQTFAPVEYYKVALTIETYEGCKETYYGKVYPNGEPKPVCQASFRYSNEMVSNPDLLQYKFFNTSVGDVVDAMWYFGDGTRSSEFEPFHTYKEHGMYEVCLEVKTANGYVSRYCDMLYTKDVPISACETWFDIYPLDSEKNGYVFQPKVKGKVVHHFWDFGDGSISLEASPRHVFTQPGLYLVKLNIETAEGCEGFYSQHVEVVGSATNCPATIHARAIQPDKLGYELHLISQCEFIEYAWNINGEVFLNEPVPTHHFKEKGNYKICVFATTPAGETYDFCKEIIVGDPELNGCTSFFVQEPMRNVRCLNCFQFKNLSAGDHLEYFWDFGDGNTSIEESPVHTYERFGIYKVCLTVVGGEDCKDIYCLEVNAGYNPVQSNCYSSFRYDVLESYPEIFAFHGYSKNDVVSWHWEFGDGQEAFEQDPRHSYAKTLGYNMKYEVCLTTMTADSCFSTYCEIVQPSSGGVSQQCNDILNLSVQDESAPGKCDGRASVKLIDMSGVVLKDVKYSWSNGFHGEDVTGLCGSKPYMVTANKSDGCEISTWFMLSGKEIVNSDDVIKPYYWTAENDGRNFKFNAPDDTDDAEYTWNIGNGETINGKEVDFEFPEDGVYTVTLTVEENGKQTNYSKVIDVKSSSGIGDIENNDEIIFYPNPVSETLFVHSTSGNSTMNISIYSITGKLILNKHFEDYDNISIPMADFPAGIYMLKINNSNYSSKLYKLLKQ